MVCGGSCWNSFKKKSMVHKPCIHKILDWLIATCSLIHHVAFLVDLERRARVSFGREKIQGLFMEFGFILEPETSVYTLLFQWQRLFFQTSYFRFQVRLIQDNLRPAVARMIWSYTCYLAHGSYIVASNSSANQ